MKNKEEIQVVLSKKGKLNYFLPGILFASLALNHLDVFANNQYTNEDVTIYVEASDNQSGLRTLEFPDGTIRTYGEPTQGTDSIETTFSVAENGAYTFIARDVATNETRKTEFISHIDKTAPDIEVEGNISNWTNEPFDLTFTAEDETSGLAFIQMPDGSIDWADGVLGENEFRYDAIITNENYNYIDFIDEENNHIRSTQFGEREDGLFVIAQDHTIQDSFSPIPGTYYRISGKIEKEGEPLSEDRWYHEILPDGGEREPRVFAINDGGAGGQDGDSIFFHLDDDTGYFEQVMYWDSIASTANPRIIHSAIAFNETVDIYDLSIQEVAYEYIHEENEFNINNLSVNEGDIFDYFGGPDVHSFVHDGLKPNWEYEIIHDVPMYNESSNFYGAFIHETHRGPTNESNGRRPGDAVRLKTDENGELRIGVRTYLVDDLLNDEFDISIKQVRGGTAGRNLISQSPQDWSADNFGTQSGPNHPERYDRKYQFNPNQYAIRGIGDGPRPVGRTQLYHQEVVELEEGQQYKQSGWFYRNPIENFINESSNTTFYARGLRGTENIKQLQRGEWGLFSSVDNDASPTYNQPYNVNLSIAGNDDILMFEPEIKVLTSKLEDKYTVHENGEYTFRALDMAGNLSEHTEYVDRIDVSPPSDNKINIGVNDSNLGDNLFVSIEEVDGIDHFPTPRRDYYERHFYADRGGSSSGPQGLVEFVEDNHFERAVRFTSYNDPLIFEPANIRTGVSGFSYRDMSHPEGRVPLEEGRVYEMSVYARTDSDEETLYIGFDGNNIDNSVSFRIDNEWQLLRIRREATGVNTNARFYLSGLDDSEGANFYIADPQLREVLE